MSIDTKVLHDNDDDFKKFSNHLNGNKVDISPIHKRTRKFVTWPSFTNLILKKIVEIPEFHRFRNL